MRKPAEVMDGDGVGLRRLRSRDAAALLELVVQSLDHLEPWIAFVQPGFGESDAARHAEQCEDRWLDGSAYSYLITVDGGRPVGRCVLNARIGPAGFEIGYWLHPDHTGRGICTRAVALLVAEAFRIGANRMEIAHDVANVRSAAVAARLGFVEFDRRARPPELATPGEAGVDIVWSLSRESGPPAP